MPLKPGTLSAFASGSASASASAADADAGTLLDARNLGNALITFIEFKQFEYHRY